jgi:hypothetical protein
MKHNKIENDIEQESVLGFLTTFGFLKKGSQELELEQVLETLASNFFHLLIPK